MKDKIERQITTMQKQEKGYQQRTSKTRNYNKTKAKEIETKQTKQ